MQSLRSLWIVLDGRARRDFVMLALLSTLAGFLETLSVGLIIPFMAAATRTGPFGGSKIWIEKWHSQLTAIGVNEESYALALALLFVAGNLVANGTVVYYQYFALKVVYQQKASLGTRLLAELAHKSLGWYESQNSGELSKSVMADVERVILSMSSLTQLVGITIRVSILACFFMLAQLRLAITLAGALLLSFYVVFRFVHRPLVAAGHQSLQSLTQMYELAADVFGGTRELKVTQTEDYFVRRFRTSAEAAVHPEVVRGMPPHVTRMGLEFSILTTIIVILVYFHTRDGNLANGLPILSAYAIAGIRLLPPLQQAIFHWVQIRFLNPSAFRVEQLLTPEPGRRPPSEVSPSLEFQRAIHLHEVDFSYPGVETTLQSISLRIEKNERVALVGSTGAGKSTLMDLLLGLRVPVRGQILIDETPLTPANTPAWLSKVGYVPQNVYLLDASVRDNVAFGVPPEGIDQARVEQACRSAYIHDFIVNELPQGYLSAIGERGVRLSGGQCQRLSIARALYHDPEVVLFDEATSALDNATEDLILKALDGLRGRKTLIVVAHRLNTVWDFDKIFVMEKGKLVGCGRAEDLQHSCPAFHKLVRQTPTDRRIEKVGTP
ncbi:ABC transporter ATP-binding protein [bacterium]|nr:ABC transporter ATP-binding protein [bacterium]